MFRRHSFSAATAHDGAKIQRYAAIMLKRASVSLFSHAQILSSYAGDQGAFIDWRASKHVHEIETHACLFKRCKYSIRGFADVRTDECTKSQSDHLIWPESTPATAIPTPYQIFHLDKTAVYSKKHFYELVKLYHPDRHISEPNLSNDTSISRDVRIERYRLVVAAHKILSDPVKRSAYDKYGSGWGEHMEISRPENVSNYHYHYYYYGYGYRSRYRARWSSFYADDSPMKNATWEDWERWYQRHNREKRRSSAHFSHESFLFMAVALASLVGVLQAKQMGATSFASPAVHFDIMTGECNKNLQSRRIISRESESNHHRLERFLESRTPQGNGTLKPKDDIPPRLLAPPDS